MLLNKIEIFAIRGLDFSNLFSYNFIFETAFFQVFKSCKFRTSFFAKSYCEVVKPA